ncbi:MAG TPA: oxidoreductase [Bacteroidia bacterium]|nr:oxidoreductase [Bacteroidia bacterium]
MKVLHSGLPSNIRALSVVNDSVVWLAGSNGYVGRSTDGGKTIKVLPVPGMDSADFRTLYAFDDKNALVVNIGSPARVFRTTDGFTWTQVYENTHQDVFVDGIGFWNASDGVIYGDPIDGQLFLLMTSDSGKTWQELSDVYRPLTVPGEASFAASGTAIQCAGDSTLLIATGGTVARLLVSNNRGISWQTQVTPITQGTPSTGIYSVAQGAGELIVITGGNYKSDSTVTDAVFFSPDGGASWQQPVNGTNGLRECVFFTDKFTAIAVGPNGIDWSTSACRNWSVLSEQKGFHVARKARNGESLFVAGKGMLAQMYLPEK